MPWEFNNNEPIYKQLVDKLKFLIICEELSAGSKLSSVRELAEEAGVNPNTMQRALQELERQELVYTERTNGRYVTENEEHIKELRTDYAKGRMKEVTETLLQMGYSKQELIELVNECIL